MMTQIINIYTFELICVLLGILSIYTTAAHREHKVHNIVLYPDKHSWCKTLAIKQVISYPGCKSEEIDNNVCVGTCFSYSIPHTEPSDPGEVIVPYCDSCQPSDTTWHHVTLECTKNSVETPPQLVKRVQIINNCSCSSCEKSFNNQIHTPNQLIDDDDNDLIMSHVVHHDVPDVLKIPNNRNNINDSTIVTDTLDANLPDDDGISTSNNNENEPSSTNNDKFKDIKQILNHKIITLLKNIQENNSLHDKEQLMDLLRMIQGPNSKLNDKNIEEFVNSLHSENIELDIIRLKEILVKFEHSKFYEKHRKHFDLHNNPDAINTNIHHLNNENDGNENQFEIGTNNDGFPLPSLILPSPSLSSSSSEDQQHSLSNHHHDSLLVQNNENVGLSQEDKKIYEKTDGENHAKHHSHHPHHSHHLNSHYHHHSHHHVGENVVGHGHLARGPHGALVIEPSSNENHNGHDDDQLHNEQHEKLDVNPHELKPNHAGTLLSYSGHSVENHNP